MPRKSHNECNLLIPIEIVAGLLSLPLGRHGNIAALLHRSVGISPSRNQMRVFRPSDLILV